MKYSISFRFYSLLFLFHLFVAVAFAARDSHAMAMGDCEFTVNVQTGTEDGAGTDAVIYVLLSNARSEAVELYNLQQWGVMGSSHDYFEKGNLDTFRFTVGCIRDSLCSINVTSNGAGANPGWYLDYIEVTTSSGQMSHFEFDRWLDINEPPYTLTATIDSCN